MPWGNVLLRYESTPEWGKSREGNLGRRLRIFKVDFIYCIYLKTAVVEPEKLRKTWSSKISKYLSLSVVRL